MSPAHTPDSARTRRRVLAGLGLALGAGLTGCTDDGPDADGPGAEPTDSDGGSGVTPTRTETATTAGDGTDSTNATEPELDLREANIVGVAVERDGSRYSFDVTLHHDDDGEDGYANWWQVERLGGDRIGRRELLHPHMRQPFTRSDTFVMPDDVSCLVVRGHDETHGYGGRAMTVDLASGATRAVDQGSERRQILREECP